MNDEWRTRLRFLLGTGVLGWELGVDHLRHWPPTFILAVWLLGGPVAQVITFLTSGRIQIVVREPEKDENDDEDGKQ